MEKRVVIIGAGLTGVSISANLIKNKIPHFLIGDPPNNFPKLGESINPDGTTELINHFDKFKKYFYEKKLTIIGVGKYKIHCHFSNIGNKKFVRSILNFISPGLKVPKAMVHIDRSKFDKDLWDSIKDSEYITHYQSRVKDINYDKASDEIQEITLEDGTHINVKTAFDATNHVRLLGRTIDLPMQKLSETQRVTFCHYYNDNFDMLDQCEWEHSTNLLKLTKDVDGIDGFAWCIPLMDYVSVGVSITAKKNKSEEMDSEEVMELLRQAYLKRGLDYLAKFPRANKAISVYNQYFTHNRAYGKNWLLAGPAYNQIWYMSGSGVACSLTASYIAKDFIQSPEVAGKRYQNYMDEYMRTHHTIDWFVQTKPEDMTYKKFSQMTYQWLLSNIGRMVRYPVLRNKKLANTASKVVSFLLGRKFINEKNFSFHKLCPPSQVCRLPQIWEGSSISLREIQSCRENSIHKLFNIISNQRPIDNVDLIMSSKILLWMDRKPFWGRTFWKIWVQFLQRRTQVENLILKAETFKHDEDGKSVHIIARWHGRKNQRQESSRDVIGRAYFDEKTNKLISIKSKSSNYTFILGEWFATDIVFFLYLPIVLISHLMNNKLYLPAWMNRK